MSVAELLHHLEEEASEVGSGFVARVDGVGVALEQGVGVVDDVLERVLFKAAVEFVGDDVLLAALAAVVRREQLEQVRTAAGQDHPVRWDLPRSHLIHQNQQNQQNYNLKLQLTGYRITETTE